MFESKEAIGQLRTKKSFKVMKNYFIGIDFSKKSFDATVLRRDEPCAQGVHQVFNNTTSGLSEFKKWVIKTTGSNSTENILICGENTGVYSKLISDSLSNSGYSMWLESALQIKRSLGLTRGKNDRKDSRDIAEYAIRHNDKFKQHTPLSKELEALQVLFSQRRLFVLQKKALATRSNELKSKYNDNNLLSVSRKCDDRLIKFYDEEIKKINKQMQSIIEKCDELKVNYNILTSMKGVGLMNAIAMLIYTNNFKRFDFDARRICSYWGVAPFGYQSGTSLNGTPHVSKYADSYLKGLLSEAVICAIRFCPAIRNYAHKLAAKGKHPAIIKNNCKNKMIHILVAMVKNKTLYGEIKKITD